jgi:anti-sigma regulatory factor (Ser/Thr protein kinase)
VFRWLRGGPDRPRAVHGQAARFQHLGFLYRTSDDYLAGTVPFVTAALAADQPVLVAVPPANLDLIRGQLGRDAKRVIFADMTHHGRNPGRIIPAVLLRFAGAHPGRRVSIIGEPIWPGRSSVEYPACAAHEALINAAFAGRDAAILCPYDAGRLEPRAVADAHRTHPVMMENGSRWASTGYRDPVETAGSFNLPLPEPPRVAATMDYRHRSDLAALRRFITDRAAAGGVPDDRADGLAVAVNELATNTIEHTAGGGRLATWSEPKTLVCHIQDTGHLTDPLAGRIPVSPDAPCGRGLVLVNQLCDLVRIHTLPGRTTIRLHTYL